MKFKEYLLIADSVTEETQERMKRLDPPKSLKKSLWRRFLAKVVELFAIAKNALRCGYLVPSDLNGLGIGKYLYLSDILQNEAERFPIACFNELAGLTDYEVLELPTEQAVGYLNFVAKELAKIAEAIASQSMEATAQERNAGVERLPNGAFALLDYIARRQRITIAEAERTQWPMVVAMLQADKEAELYRRRLQKQYSKN